MNINNVVVAGRLTKDPELRYTPGGDATCSITVAINRPFKNSAGENEADFLNCVLWKGRAETVANHFKKGDEIGGTGRVQTRNYENQEGKRVFVTEIVLESFSFGSRRSENQSNTNTQQNNQQRQDNNYTRIDDDPFANNGGSIDISDDDMPF